MSCDCHTFEPLELDRKSINCRIKQSPALRERLQVIAENNEQDLGLLRCPDCGQFWQSGREWNFGYKEYVFQVPPIEPSDWQHEPYVQPAALLIYSDRIRTLMEQARFTATSERCKVPGCDEHTVTSSVFCLAHHTESLQKAGRLPQTPKGRPFPPYSV
jgi:hypothetical protein